MLSDLTFGSLFSGIGGLDLGLIDAGLELKWQCENDEFCRQLLKKRFGVKIYKDVKTSKFSPNVDILVGGFPCQPVSHAGKKLFQEDDRWLWPYFLEIIDELLPRWVVIENVDGLRTRGLYEVLQGLASIGYDAEWDRIPAATFGAPHLRYRYFIFAYPSSQRWNKGSYFRYFGEKEKRALDKFKRSNDYASNKNNTSCFTSYPHGKRLQRFGQAGKLRAVEKEIAVGGFGWWGVEPDVGRVVYGIPSRVDRLKGLGNAVVPFCGYFMGKLIYFAESKQDQKGVIKNIKN